VTRLLRPVEVDRGGRPVRSFCGHCGHAPEPATPPAGRVCGRCGLGLVLSAPEGVAPSPVDPFLVVDNRLVVCAVSRAGEELLATVETDAVNRHVCEFLVPAETEAPDPHNLLVQLIGAAAGDGEPRTVVVRPTGVFGVRFWARVGPCGPPSAALVVLAA
jgi:hypothetical protein